MNTNVRQLDEAQPSVDVDVLIVGAGLSGIGSAYHLQDKCPGTTYTILESRDAIGGTWDLFRYPGIRSDSDMHTLGFNFKPWTEAKAIADGPSIRRYVQETAKEYGIDRHIAFGNKVSDASWDSSTSRWTVTTQTAAGERSYTGNFLLMCAGYYSYSNPYTPEFKGIDQFNGQIIHPQHWPEDLDYSGKRVVVIGSGATAMTLVPAMAEKVAHITMVQRSPTYVASRPDQDAIANTLRRFLPDKWAYAITRFKNTQMQRYVYNKTRVAPEKVKQHLLDVVRKNLGPDYDVDKHFTPRYNPWDQRLCLIPNGDLFDAINSGQASVVTEQIEGFEASGLRLQNGDLLEADIIVTATGLNLQVLGGAQFHMDGMPIDFADHYTYKGMMYSDIPNLVQTFGYINASWTLRADLTAEWACRVINRMRELGKSQATPRFAQADQNMPARPWIQDFSAGYMQRLMHLFPKQGDHEPWLNTQDFSKDKKMVRNSVLEDGRLTFSEAQSAAVMQPAEEISAG